MKKILISIGSVASLSVLPALALAQKLDYATNLINSTTTLLGRVLVFLISLAVVWFIYNVIRFAMTEGDEAKENAKQQMIWGIVAIAVSVSVWGLVGLLQTAFLSGKGGTAPTSVELNGMIPGVPGR